MTVVPLVRVLRIRVRRLREGEQLSVIINPLEDGFEWTYRPLVIQRVCFIKIEDNRDKLKS